MTKNRLFCKKRFFSQMISDILKKCLFLKKVVRRDFVLDDTAVFVVTETEGGDHYEVKRAPQF